MIVHVSYIPTQMDSLLAELADAVQRLHANSSAQAKASPDLVAAKHAADKALLYLRGNFHALWLMERARQSRTYSNPLVSPIRVSQGAAAPSLDLETATGFNISPLPSPKGSVWSLPI